MTLPYTYKPAFLLNLISTPASTVKVTPLATVTSELARYGELSLVRVVLELMDEGNVVVASPTP
jgi:hypothetical protein